MQPKIVLIVVLLVSIAFAAGCIGQTIATSDVKITAAFDPPEIKPVETTTLYIDVENTGDKNVSNLTIDVFDTGPLSVIFPSSGSCIATLGHLTPAQIMSAECQMKVTNPPALTQLVTTGEARFKTSFSSNISATIVIDAATLEEYRQLERTGNLKTKPQTYTFSDSQVEATLTLNKQPPLIAGETVISHLALRNIGPGNVYTLNPKQFEVYQAYQVMDCNFDNIMYSSDGTFTPITCVFTIPDDVPRSTAYPVTFIVGYNYEFRGSAPITIKRD